MLQKLTKRVRLKEPGAARKYMSEAVVYLIDDDEAVRKSLAFLLKAAQLNVRTHESAVAFLKVLPKAGPGCIITDMHMPQVDGIELIRRLRDHGCNLPVIVITGVGDLRHAVEAIKAGAIDFLEKPICAEMLLALIRSAFVCGGWSRGHESVATCV